jgi:hypothetical protein
LHVSDGYYLSDLSSLLHHLSFFRRSLIVTMYFRLFVLAIVHIVPTLAEVSNGQGNCTCGFYDSVSKELFTDSIIVYFNETTSLPTEFVAEEFAQKYAKDWVYDIISEGRPNPMLTLPECRLSRRRAA